MKNKLFIVVLVISNMLCAINYGERMMDPRIGRFLSRDASSGKAQSPQSVNRYLYVENNPIVFIDPTGRFRVLAHKEHTWGHVGYQGLGVSYDYGRWAGSWGPWGAWGEGVLKRTPDNSQFSFDVKNYNAKVYDFKTSTELDKIINTAYRKKWDAGKQSKKDGGKINIPGGHSIDQYFILGPNCVTTTFDMIETALNDFIKSEMLKAPDMQNKGLIKEAKDTLEKIKPYRGDIDPKAVADKLKNDKNVKDVTDEYVTK